MPPPVEILEAFAGKHQPALLGQVHQSGNLEFAFGGEFLVHTRSARDALDVVMWLGDLPTQVGERQTMLRRLMRAELAGLARDEVILSVDEDTAEMFIHVRLSGERLTLLAFEQALAALVERLQTLRSLAQGPARSARLTPPPMIIRP